jgi:hypothetical protein
MTAQLFHRDTAARWARLAAIAYQRAKTEKCPSHKANLEMMFLTFQIVARQHGHDMMNAIRRGQ